MTTWQPRKSEAPGFRIMTIFCSDPSHCETPVEPLITEGHLEPSIEEASATHVRLSRTPGLWIVSLVWNYSGATVMWAPQHLTAAGVTKRNGGHKDGWRLRCDCTVGSTARRCGAGPGRRLSATTLGSMLTLLADDEGATAVSVSVLRNEGLIQRAEAWYQDQLALVGPNKGSEGQRFQEIPAGIGAEAVLGALRERLARGSMQ